MLRFCRERKFADGFENNKNNNRSRENDGAKKKAEAKVVGDRGEKTEAGGQGIEDIGKEAEAALSSGVSRAARRGAGKESGLRTQLAVVKKLLKKVEEKLSREDVKASLADYIRLLQLHKELDEEAPREIRVTWVEPKDEEAEMLESEG
mgnify:CR=1 FL=1